MIEHSSYLPPPSVINHHLTFSKMFIFGYVAWWWLTCRIPLNCCCKLKAIVYWQSLRYAKSFSQGCRFPAGLGQDSPCRSLSLPVYGHRSLSTCRLIGNLLQCASICLSGLWTHSWKAFGVDGFDGSLGSISNVFSVEMTFCRWHLRYSLVQWLTIFLFFECSYIFKISLGTPTGSNTKECLVYLTISSVII